MEKAPLFPLDGSTWIISDTHFFHANIGQYCSRPEGWQDLIIENCNLFIQPSDTIFHLGDLALSKMEDAETLIPLLNGKLYLLRGNHDRRGKTFFQGLGIALVKASFGGVWVKSEAGFFAPPDCPSAAKSAQPTRAYQQQSCPRTDALAHPT
ncbi:MAG: metallophosphoesterase [Anaerolineales bacterium]|nr:metallophosphoesterase [Anaerolineales bacterium]